MLTKITNYFWNYLKNCSSVQCSFLILRESANTSSLVQLTLKPSLKRHLLKKPVRKCSHSCLGIPHFFASQYLLFTVMKKCNRTSRVKSSSVFGWVLLLGPWSPCWLVLCVWGHFCELELLGAKFWWMLRWLNAVQWYLWMFECWLPQQLSVVTKMRNT